ncbi:hypothetical protein [Aestuariivirga sp.]|uniref:hypothetical protein n=1 Tax=Aestuariivirga sp. TaxID=2650926 RepID=UPI0025C34EC8|nr:hypothetical protein [Aestuariivirga sp.]MCA3554127.1 hypothetical protein [Aestuariivirga sp.]
MAFPAASPTPQDAVAAYKRLLAEIIDRRPSGTRQRLASALAKNRSFVSQIANPAYPTPIPASHLAQIFEVCRFSAAERQEFTRLYARAHPKKMLAEKTARMQPVVALPDLGDDAKNRTLHGLVSAFVRDLARLIGDEREKGKRP